MMKTTLRTWLPAVLFALVCNALLGDARGQEAPAPSGNTATPIDRITVADGFKVELLYSVPSETQGSWVNLCTDNKGRLLVSDQFGELYRITPPPAGESLDPATIEKVPAKIRAVNGT